MRRPAVDELEELDDAAWDSAVERSAGAFRFSHRAAAGRAFERAYPAFAYRPCRARFSDGVDMLVPMVRVERRIRALGMALGMPLGLEGTPIVLSGVATGAHYASLRGALGGVGILTIHGGAGGSPTGAELTRSDVTHVLQLNAGFEALWTSSFSPQNRNKCRKAERAGVVVSEESTQAGAEEYRQLYETATGAWGYDEPPYPPGLFGALLQSGEAELWLARLEGSAIAGALFLRGSDDLFYWSGAMNREYRDVAPANAIIRLALESACNRGLSYFDFGASSSLTGVEKFKTSFGAEPRPYGTVTVTSRAYRTATGLLGAFRKRGRS